MLLVPIPTIISGSCRYLFQIERKNKLLDAIIKYVGNIDEESALQCIYSYHTKKYEALFSISLEK